MKRGFLLNTSKPGGHSGTKRSTNTPATTNASNNGEDATGVAPDDLGPLQDPRVRAHAKREEIKANWKKNFFLSNNMTKNYTKKLQEPAVGWGRENNNDNINNNNNSINSSSYYDPELVKTWGGARPPPGSRIATQWNMPSSSSSHDNKAEMQKQKRLKVGDDGDDEKLEDANEDDDVVMVEKQEQAEEEEKKVLNEDAIMQVESSSLSAKHHHHHQPTAPPKKGEEANNYYNPFSITPMYPTSMFGTPKVALNSLYGKEFKDFEIILTGDSFFVWDDENPKTHIKKFTCVFVCPATYELFPAARYEDGSKKTSYVVDESGTGVVWFSKKKNAEQAAAGRRHDCFVYRQACAMAMAAKNKKKNLVPARTAHWVLDPPYRNNNAEEEEDNHEAALLPRRQLMAIPNHVQQQIDEYVVQLKQDRAQQLALRQQRAMDIEDVALQRQSYREQRLLALP